MKNELKESNMKEYETKDTYIHYKEKIEGLKNWYHIISCCAVCGTKIRQETWDLDKENCYSVSTILSDNSMPKYCPNCGEKLSTV